MTLENQHDAEDRLRDLMALGDMARKVAVCLAAAQSGAPLLTAVVRA